MEQQLCGEGVSSHEERAERPPKKPYAPPQLVVHGTIQDITKNLGGAGADGALGLVS